MNLFPTLALVALLAVVSCARSAPPGGGDVHVLRYASPYSPTHPFSRADIAWIHYVETASHGRIKIEAHWSGALLSGDNNIVELRHGVADIALITPIYVRGGAHAIRAQTAFYAGVRTIAGQTQIYKCLAAEFPALAHEMDGLRVLAVQGGNLPGFLTVHRPVRTLDDLRGLRIRAPSELTSTLRRLGADPVNMPMSEVYSAMAKGVIDGVVAPPDTMRALHFAEVASYYTVLAISRGGYPGRAISERSFQRLPSDLQQVLIESSPVWEAAMERELHAAVSAGEAFGRQRGIRFIDAVPSDQITFDTLYNQDALTTARELNQFGIDGEPIFRRAQALGARLEAGQALDCGGSRA